MELSDVGRIAEGFEGVRLARRAGRAEWRYRGRLVARQLDDGLLVIRSEFALRAALVRRHPETFSVPRRLERHMMVVADLEHGSAAAIEDALTAAWELQRRGAR